MNRCDNARVACAGLRKSRYRSGMTQRFFLVFWSVLLMLGVAGRDVSAQQTPSSPPLGAKSPTTGIPQSQSNSVNPGPPQQMATGKAGAGVLSSKGLGSAQVNQQRPKAPKAAMLGERSGSQMRSGNQDSRVGEAKPPASPPPRAEGIVNGNNLAGTALPGDVQLVRPSPLESLR